MKLKQTIIFSLSFFIFHFALAQSPLSVLENRLCKTWQLTKTMQGDRTANADNALKDFVMIINSNHTVKQGISPDGLIGGSWSVEEKTMMLIIKDDVTKQEYKMKIVSVTTDELVLQDPSSNPAIYIHYRAK